MTSAIGAEVPTSSDISELLMLKEIPRLAAIVTIIAQPFGQFREHFGDMVPEATPLAVAALCSVLLAFFLVRSVKHSTVSQAAYTIPLIALIVFSGSLGANNVVDVARSGSSPLPAQSAASPPSATQPQIKDIEEQLRLEQHKTDLLRQAIGLPPESDPPARSAPSANAATGTVSAILNLFVTPAYAQQATPRTKTTAQSVRVAKNDPALLEKMQELDRQTRLLQAKRDSLKAQEASQSNSTRRPLWKSW
jgi:hypothetical protein